jgi:hypothetical protein
MSSAGTKTVTVTYTESGVTKTTTYSITVTAVTTYALTYSVNGTTSSGGSYASGAAVTLPTTETAPTGYTFAGFVTNAILTETTTAPTFYAPGASYTMPAAATTLYALFTRTSGSGSGGNTYTLTNDLSAGDYVIGALVGTAGTDNNIAAINATLTNGWLKYTLTTPSNGVITMSDTTHVWTLAASGTGYTLVNKSSGQYLTLSSTIGSGSASVATTAATVYASVVDATQKTFEMHDLATSTATSGNQLCCNLGTGYGYRMYAERTHVTTTTGISTQIRFFKASASSTTYYVTTVQAAYTITAASNNTSYGTVSLSGSTITATPATGYQVSASTPYTVTSGTATVTQSGNTFTVTPTSNCTVTINFEKITPVSLALSGQTTAYTVNDTFAFSGTATVTYSDGTTAAVTPTSVSSPDMTTAGNKTVTVSYTENGTTVTATYTITVSAPALDSIALTGQTKAYTVGDTFSFDGTCTATYSNGTTAVVTPTSVSSPDMSTAGAKNVTVTYTENGVTKTSTYTINVTASSTYALPPPTRW